MSLGPKSHIKARLDAIDAGYRMGKIGEEVLAEWDDVCQVLVRDWTDEEGFDEDGYNWEWSAQWQITLGEVNAHIRRVNPGGKRWRADTTNYDWQHHNGYKHFQAEKAEELLNAVLHKNTDHHWTLYDYTTPEEKAGLALTFSNHDVHGAWVYLVPTEDDPEDDEEGDDDVTEV